MTGRLYKVTIALEDSTGFFPEEMKIIVTGLVGSDALEKGRKYIDQLQDSKGYFVNQIEYIGDLED